MSESVWIRTARLGLVLSLMAMPTVAEEPPPVPGPSFEQVLGLRTVGSPRMAPDGSAVAFTTRSVDWENNRWDTEIWLARKGAEPIPMTRTADGSSTNPQWSPNGEWIAFVADRGDGRQVYAIRVAGGEAVALTAAPEGVGGYLWSPDGGSIAYLMAEEKSKAKKAREDRYGRFAVEDQETRIEHIWLVEVAPDPWPTPAEAPCEESGAGESEEDAEGSDAPAEEAAACAEAPEPRRLTEGDSFTVVDFSWSPDGKTLAVEHQADSNVISYHTRDISLLDIESGELTALIDGPGVDGGVVWSPDSRHLIYRSAVGNVTTDYIEHGHLLKISRDGGETVRLGANVDAEVGGVTWTDQGLYLVAWQRTLRQLFRVDPESGEATVFGTVPDRIWGIHPSADGSELAFAAHSSEGMTDIYRTRASAWLPERVTEMDSQFADWSLPETEIITWTSRDGAEIEGVLYKPPGLDPDTKHPLLVVIHGGPAGIDYRDPVPSYVYPIAQWVAKGAMVLRPNYRGSIGYGQDFRKLNMNNLGVGDAWDVLSGVDHLVEQGLVDENRMGAMGWSQGGYISAFLTTATDRFAAISVGAGISNWMTYYVNTDIHPFTRQYLSATPWEDPEIYALTSPMTRINEASTPTLIQHGENDRRVPAPNAYELFQGLSDVGVDTRLVIYEGFGHGITKPKERLAAIWHNWQWFARYLWNEEVDLPLDLPDQESSASVE